MLNSIFGAMGQAALTGQGIYQTNQQSLANAPQWMHQASLAQQQMTAYNAAMMQNKPRWVIDGVTYSSAKQFALAMWPDDEQARLMFALKYGEE